MTNLLTLVGDLFRRLPLWARTTLYVLVVAGFAAVKVCDHYAVTSVGPVPVSDVEAVLEWVAPLVGMTAFANRSRGARATRRATPAMFYSAEIGETRLSNTEVERIARAVAIELRAAGLASRARRG